MRKRVRREKRRRHFPHLKAEDRTKRNRVRVWLLMSAAAAAAAQQLLIQYQHLPPQKHHHRHRLMSGKTLIPAGNIVTIITAVGGDPLHRHRSKR
jgi:hypothetical protein